MISNDMICSPVGEHCPVNMWSDVPYVFVLERGMDPDGYQIGRRINGFVQCPKCSVWWPNVEEPDRWQEDDDGAWQIIGWWGAAVCVDCGLLMVEQPGGAGESYEL